ncbi:MAG: YdcH family protein [Alphaproteobacteria bacterium]
MSHVPHELAEDFPDDAALIHALKRDNAHFARLADAYHVVNRAVHRIETKVEAASDVRHEELRRERMRLKDEIAAMLRAAKAR